VERPNAVELSNRYAFRRNRTLTGSSSAQVTSTNELNAELRSPRAHVHHLTSLRRRLLLYFASVATGAFMLYLLLSQLVASATIQLTGVGTPPTDDAAAYQKALDSYYAAKPVERLRFALNQKALLSHMQALRPEIKALSINPGSGLGNASVALEVRQPIARWSLNGSNQYVDGNGIVFARNYFDDPHLQIIDNSGLSSGSNQLVASNRFLGFVGRVIANAATRGLTVTKVVIPALTTRQIDVTLAGKATSFKLSVDRSAGQQVEDIARITTYLAAHQLNPTYVDVRVEGKSYYK
jgi:cell division septal protein FtsQ